MHNGVGHAEANALKILQVPQKTESKGAGEDAKEASSKTNMIRALEKMQKKLESQTTPNVAGN